MPTLDDRDRQRLSKARHHLRLSLSALPTGNRLHMQVLLASFISSIDDEIGPGPDDEQGVRDLDAELPAPGADGWHDAGRRTPCRGDCRAAYRPVDRLARELAASAHPQAAGEPPERGHDLDEDLRELSDRWEC